MNSFNEFLVKVQKPHLCYEVGLREWIHKHVKYMMLLYLLFRYGKGNS